MKPDDIKLHLEELYSYARPRMMDQLEIDEVLANTFSKALRAGSQDMSSGKHDSVWLTGILRKQILVHYRNKYQSEESIAKARNSVKEVLDRAFDIPENFSGLDANMLGKSNNQAFWNAFNECVEMLNAVQADVFILRDLEDVSVEEVCGIFRLSRGDVLELIYRARVMLVACLIKSQETEN